MASKPTHEQAQLQLQVYDMRREARLREARDWFFKNYFVESVEDAMRLAAPGSEGGKFVGMVLVRATKLRLAARRLVFRNQWRVFWSLGAG